MGVALARVQGIRRRELPMTRSAWPPPCLPGAEPAPLPAAREYEGGHDSASRTHQSLLRDRRLRTATPRRRGEGPQAPSFGAAGAHVRAAGAWRTPRPLHSHRAIGATRSHFGLRSQVPLPPSSAGSAVSTETSFPLPFAPYDAPSDWLFLASVRRAEPIADLRR